MLLASPPSVHELLLELTPARALRKKTVRYISNRVYELLDIAVNGSDVELSGRALAVLAGPNTSILATASESLFFQKNFAEILASGGDHDDRRVSAFATAVGLCLGAYPGDLQVSFSFFSRFLEFCDNVSVLLMFKDLLVYSDKLRPLYSQLKALKFVDRVALQISELRAEEVGGAQLSALYEVAGFCAGNYRLRKCCLEPVVIQAFVEMSVQDGIEVMNAQWGLLSELCCEEVAGELEEVFEKAACRLGDAMHPYVASAMDFCARMIRINGAVFDSVNAKVFLRNVKRACCKNSQCSIALKSASRLILAGMEALKTREQFARAFLGFIAEAVRNKEERIVYAHMIDVARKVGQMAEDDEDLASLCFGNESFASVYRTEVVQYGDILERDYGGFSRLSNSRDLFFWQTSGKSGLQFTPPD